MNARHSSAFRLNRTTTRRRCSTRNLLGMHEQISHAIPVNQLELTEAADNLRICSDTPKIRCTDLLEARAIMKYLLVRFLAHLIALDPELAPVARPVSHQLPGWSELGFLPAGIYEISFEDFAWRFSFTTHRRRLLSVLFSALHELRRSGIKEVTIGGSFLSTKKNPKDVDLFWPDSDDPNPLDNKSHPCYRRWVRRLDALPDYYGFKTNLLSNRTLGFLPTDVPETMSYKLGGRIPTRIAVGVVRLNLEQLPDRLAWLEDFTLEP